MKMNALVDPVLIDALYDASQKGAEIDLLVRGICCLHPGVPGLSERIRVRSIIGRFLEHSRIFRFGPSDGPAEYLIGSADLMPRNLDRRIEALLTVTGAGLQARLDEILEVELADDVAAWELTADGTWKKVRGDAGIESQRRLQELALARVQADPNERGIEHARRSDAAGSGVRTGTPHGSRRPGAIGAVIRDALDASVQRLLVADPVARVGDDPEGVHQARVATRRLRSDLRTFAPLLDPAWVDAPARRARAGSAASSASRARPRSCSDICAITRTGR